MIKKIFILSVLLTTAAAYAQVAPAATGGRSSLWAGGEYSNYKSDFAGRFNGVGALVDFDVTPKLGAIGEARWFRWDGGYTNSDYLAGVKYRMYRFNRFSFNAKFVLGGVWINFQPGICGTGCKGSYFAYAPGGFVDYRLSRKFLARAGYEYQFIPSAPDVYPFGANGLNPNGFSIGVEYRIFSLR